MDAITMLKDDHKAVEQLFKRFEKAGPRAYVEKRDIVDRIIEELSMHAAVEEQLFYPVARATVPDTEDIALESLEEHGVAKWVLADLEKMSPEDERFDAKVKVLIESVRHHVEEEEQEFFPLVRDELGRNDLNELGEAMAKAKGVAPTHPHPRSPDTPPANFVVGTAAGVVDRIGDTVAGLTQGIVTAAGDLVATVLRREKPRVKPTGSRTARSTADRVRDAAADATDTVIEAILLAKRTGERTLSSAKDGAERTTTVARRGVTSTVRAASSGAKGTATSAKRSTDQATTTAKRATTTTGRTARRAAKGTATSAKRTARETADTAKRSARRAS
jgi:hemerythrin-like domain-containing protein